jgi:MFS family permease
VILLWLATGMPWFALGYFLAGGIRPARSMVTAHVDALVRRPEMGLAYGMAETAQSAALVLAPILAGLLYRLHPALPFPAGLVWIGVMLTLTLRYAPRLVPGLPPPSSPTPTSGLQPIRREMQ